MAEFKNVFELLNALVNRYRYKALPSFLSIQCRDIYTKSLPDGLSLNGDAISLFSSDGSLIAKGYDRIVVGDYGAFLEISDEDIVLENLIVKKGQEFRINDEQYRNRVKYHWLTAKDNSDCKIYYQQREVDYADYKLGFYYVSPYEVMLDKDLSLDAQIAKASVNIDVNFSKQDLQMYLFDL